MGQKKPKVVVIGLDGATFTLLKPWIDAGHLPYLKSLLAEGVSGPLQSSIPPITSPAWQCFMTGKNPGKHGVVWFMENRGMGVDEVPVTAGSLDAKTVWELLSADGKRSAVLNVPFAYPSPGFQGVLIGGFTTPPSLKDESFHPHGLLKEIEDRFGEYRMKLKTPPWVAMLLIVSRLEFAIEAFLKDCQELSDYQFNVAEMLLRREEFDCVMFYQLPPDRIQHWLWHVLDVTHPWHDAQTAQRFSDKILSYYRRLDGQIARLVQCAGGSPTVIVLSDHGFGPVVKGIDLGSWLLREGYIQIKKTAASQLRYTLWKMGWGPKSFLQTLLRRPTQWHFVQTWLTHKLSGQRESQVWHRLQERRARLVKVFKRLFLSVYDVDWTMTKAYCRMGPGLIRINLQGREPQGAVPPEAYHALRDELVAKLHALVDPATGQPIEGRAYVREDIYRGKYTERMPDIVYVSSGEYLVTNPMLFLASRLTINDIGISGFHRSEGIFIAKGEHLKKGAHFAGASLFDVAPTVLYLLGTKVPNDLDGRVITELFEEEFLADHPVMYREAPAEETRQSLELTPEDQAALLERLKGFGYID
jgi:predicted AlkP superfamily phosphohydrolase/phosphomutase